MPNEGSRMYFPSLMGTHLGARNHQARLVAAALALLPPPPFSFRQVLPISSRLKDCIL